MVRGGDRFIIFARTLFSLCFEFYTAPRSGLAAKHHIDIGAGVIDGDYRGPVGVVMFNLANKPFQVTKGMRVAQLILERYEWRTVLKEVEELDDTLRGDGGFGSTGLVDKQKENMDTSNDVKMANVDTPSS